MPSPPHASLALILVASLSSIGCAGSPSTAVSGAASSGGETTNAVTCTSENTAPCLEEALAAQDAGDLEAMLAALITACDGQHGRACGLLGDHYQSLQAPTSGELDSADSPPSSHAPAYRAAVFWSTACDLQDMTSCFNLGVAHERGDGVPADPARALELYERACEGQVASGCVNAATGAINGVGPRALDFEYGFRQSERACLLGSPHGCSMVASCHIEGIGTPINRDLGAATLREHCGNDFDLACELLRRYSIPENPAETQ